MLGGVVGAIAGFRIYPRMVPEQKWLANLVIVLCLLVFSAGAANLYGKIRSKRLRQWKEKFLRMSGQTSAQWVFLGLALLASALTAMAARVDTTKIPDFWLILAIWVSGIILVVFGAWKITEAFPKVSRKTILIAGILFIFGTAIRAIGSEQIPPLLNGDEASAGLNAVQFIEGQTNNIFGVGWFSFPSFYYALQSLSIRVFGRTTFALRFTSALIGGLTVSAVYLVGKRIFSGRAGLLAALFLAGSHFHNHFSRIGLNNIWDAFWYLLVLGMLIDGWRSKRRLPFLVAGIGLGFSQYFYVSSRFLLILIPVWVLLMTLIDRKSWKQNWLNLLFMVLVFLAITIPLIWFYAQGEGYINFLAPFNRVDLLGGWLEREVELVGKPGWRILTEQIYSSARTFISMPVQVWYPASTPILRPVSAVLFLCGLILLLFQLRNPASMMLYLWIGLFVLVGGFSVPVSSAQRYVAALPGCALIIGFCLDECAGLAGKVWQGRGKIFSVGMVLLVIGLGVSDLNFYIFKYTPQTQLGGQNTLVAQKLAEYLQEQDPMQVAFFGGSRMGYYSINSTAYLAPHMEGLDFREPWGSADNPAITSERVIFVFLPEERDNLDLVRQDYPDGLVVPEYDQQGAPLYWMYTVDSMR
jgi:4-amino-4-deoxy-L-arabinose transferase-like glycosyltransferase